MAATRPRDGYPTSWGNIRASVFPVVGPASYTQYTAPTTGGQDVTLGAASGVPQADFIVGGVSNSGLYRVQVVQIEAGPVAGSSVNVARARAVLKWYVVATDAQVAGAVDLSAETVNLLIIGPK